ncbi:unnamed protein product [Discosporangium mesarthrocarpum]
MGNKTATGTLTLDPHAEAPGHQEGTSIGLHGVGSVGRVVGGGMPGNVDGICATTAQPARNATGTEGGVERPHGDTAAEAVGGDDDGVMLVGTTPSGDRPRDAPNFTRNNSQSSMNNNGAPSPTSAGVDFAEQPTAVEARLPEPPPSSNASLVTAYPPHPGGEGIDLQLPPLNDPRALPETEETGRLSGRGSPSSAEGRDGKGAHVEVSVFKYQPGVPAPAENLHNYRINSRGAAITGSLNRPEERRDMVSGAVDIATEYEKRKGAPVARHHIEDHRAKQLLVVPNDDKFVAVAAPEAFSRHSGTCMILGGQGAYSGASKSYELKLGNFLRIGSVGVVVSEIHTGPGGEHKCLSWEELTCLKGDISAIQKDLVTIEALTAQEENAIADKRVGSGLNDGEGGVPSTRMCYMCFDDLDVPENPLVAPCQCKGDTRYVHLDCLQKWHTTTSENKVCVVLNNKGVRVCTICKSPYKASVRLPGGESISLFQSPLPPPYICFMVVTRHQNNEELFSTKYQLSFSSVMNRTGTASAKELVVGRSRQCDMVLDYRTVSTKHASVRYQGGRFYFSDLNSSNGSYLYLREPLQLPYGETVYLKWGSNVVSLKAKRSIRHRLSNLVGRRAGVASKKEGPVPDFSMLESLCEMGQSPTGEGAEDGGISAVAAGPQNATANRT